MISLDGAVTLSQMITFPKLSARIWNSICPGFTTKCSIYMVPSPKATCTLFWRLHRLPEIPPVCLPHACLFRQGHRQELPWWSPITDSLSFLRPVSISSIIPFAARTTPEHQLRSWKLLVNFYCPAYDDFLMENLAKMWSRIFTEPANLAFSERKPNPGMNWHPHWNMVALMIRSAYSDSFLCRWPWSGYRLLLLARQLCVKAFLIRSE